MQTHKTFALILSAKYNLPSRCWSPNQETIRSR